MRLQDIWDAEEVACKKVSDLLLEEVDKHLSPFGTSIKHLMYSFEKRETGDENDALEHSDYIETARNQSVFFEVACGYLDHYMADKYFDPKKPKVVVKWDFCLEILEGVASVLAKYGIYTLDQREALCYIASEMSEAAAKSRVYHRGGAGATQMSFRRDYSVYNVVNKDGKIEIIAHRKQIN